MKIFWKASWVPEAAVRTMTSIVRSSGRARDRSPIADSPPKIAWTSLLARVRQACCRRGDDAERVLAILLNTRPPGSVGFGSREDIPIVTRPRETSAIPTSEPPWGA